MLRQSLNYRRTISETSRAPCVILRYTGLAWQVAIEVKIQIFLSLIQTEAIDRKSIDLEIICLYLSIRVS
jgi:hypothetical protein